MSDLADLFEELIRFETELWNGVDHRLRADHDLALGWFEAMQVIDRLDDCRVHDIATALSITAGGTSKLVDRLEEDGCCRRRPNPVDRRSSIIRLTAAGRRVLGRATSTFDDELRRRLGTIVTRRDLARFTDTLSRLRAANLAADTAVTDPGS